jgi:hypothetical protein
VELRGLEPLTPCLQNPHKVSSTVHGLGLTGSAGPLKSVEIRARWCQPWVSPLTTATGEFGWVLSSPRSTGIAYQVHTIGLYGQV